MASQVVDAAKELLERRLADLDDERDHLDREPGMNSRRVGSRRPRRHTSALRIGAMSAIGM